MRKNSEKSLAGIIVNGFDLFFSEFQNLTRGGQARFESADWGAVHGATSDRLEMYKKSIKDVSVEACKRLDKDLLGRTAWREAKIEYSTFIKNYNYQDIAETFFNSVYGYIFQHEKIRDAHTYVLDSSASVANPVECLIYRQYSIAIDNDITALVRDIIESTDFRIPFENIDSDVEKAAKLVQRFFELRLNTNNKQQNLPATIQILKSLFYRNKAAYIVGRIIINGNYHPLVFALLNNEKGAVVIDAVLVSADEVSKLFSFARSYFMVSTDVPSLYVKFLHSIIPNKEPFELYNAIGYGKHGKTVFYRSAVAHTANSTDDYMIAPGIKGMVMMVFTLPSFDYVYKVIKDRFTPPKDMTREEVKAKYKLVKRWDLAGRMADTQEFSNLVFDRRRFPDELIEELRREAGSLLVEKGNILVLEHVYVERKMTPLNLYLKTASDSELYNAIDEYGLAIRQLAGANIFPGDMLLKNFGVTRHGRVVFYDYDEIMPLTDCNFRKIPEPITLEQEMASQPWYDVKPDDVFPEEFGLFFTGDRRARKAFSKLHGDLYEVAYWQQLQKDLKQGKYQDVFPYARRYRI